MLQRQNYNEAAEHYSLAFQSLGWKGYLEDRYNAARAWSQTDIPDSSFAQLFKIAERFKFKDVDRLEKDVLLQPLHAEERWGKLTLMVKENKKKAEWSNRPLAIKLEQIGEEDQKYRRLSDWTAMMKADSINQIEVVKILDQYGWLGSDVVGEKGNEALFLVIQHSDLEVQEKYLPLMRKAAAEGKARLDDLALLEDRVLMRQGKKQIYGSQIVKDKKGNWIVHPIEDPLNVDKRRAELGLEPMTSYVVRMGLVWNLEEHIRQKD